MPALLLQCLSRRRGRACDALAQGHLGQCLQRRAVACIGPEARQRRVNQFTALTRGQPRRQRRPSFDFKSMQCNRLKRTIGLRLDRVRAVHVRERQIHDNDVRVEAGCLVDGRLTCRCFRDLESAPRQK